MTEDVPRPAGGPTPAVLLAESSPSDSWSRFLDAYADTVYRAASRAARDPDEGRTVAAEVLERLAARWPAPLERYRERGAGAAATFRTWLGVVARNLAIDVLRARHGRGATGARVVSMDAPEAAEPEAHGEVTPAVAAARGAARQTLLETLAELSGDERALLRMYFLEGWCASDLQRLLGGRTRSQVYNRVHAVLQKLRKEVRARGLDPGDLEGLRDFDWGRALGRGEEASR